MQITIALAHNSDSQAEIIRKKWYKTTTARQTKDSFIFNEALDRFYGVPNDLVPYISSKDEGGAIAPRRLTIKTTSYNRLQTLASANNASLAATYRAIIAFTIDNLPDTGDEETVGMPVGTSKLLLEHIAHLEKRLEDCNQILKTIKELIKE